MATVSLREIQWTYSEPCINIQGPLYLYAMRYSEHTWTMHKHTVATVSLRWDTVNTKPGEAFKPSRVCASQARPRPSRARRGNNVKREKQKWPPRQQARFCEEERRAPARLLAPRTPADPCHRWANAACTHDRYAVYARARARARAETNRVRVDDLF